VEHKRKKKKKITQLDDDSSDDEAEEEYVIVVNNVHKTYLLGVEGVPALRGVTLNVRRGEFIVCLGKSGSGKTSLLNIIGTIDKPTKGYIKIAGTRKCVCVSLSFSLC